MTRAQEQRGRIAAGLPPPPPQLPCCRCSVSSAPLCAMQGATPLLPRGVFVCLRPPVLRRRTGRVTPPSRPAVWRTG